MTELANGIALYDLENLTIKKAFYYAEKFFRHININPNSIYYFYSHAPDKNGETVSTMDISLHELKIKIEQGLVSNFRMNYSTTNRLWDIGLAFSTKESEFGEGINYLEIQFLDDLLKLDAKEIKELLVDISTETRIVYGIGYQLYGSVGDAFNYALSFDSSRIYKFENSSEWLYQLPSRTDDTPQYSNKLRMVYRINFLNIEHLGLEIDGLTLKEWIMSNHENGYLEELNNFNSLWYVEESELERVNKILGNAGFLISWSPERILTNRLP